MVLPGTYTVQLWIGETKQEQKVTVLKDPKTTSTEEDLKKQHSFGLKVAESIRLTTTMIDELEQRRAELLSLTKTDAAKADMAMKMEEPMPNTRQFKDWAV